MIARPPILTAAFCLTAQMGVLWGQAASIEPQRSSASVLVRPYLAAEVPPSRQTNSSRLADLHRAGNLYLTAQDAIALALENNVDIEVARYTPILAEWRLERSKAGGLLPGVPSSAGQVGSVAIGQGVTGSQAAAGVATGRGGGRGEGTNASIAQIGPVTQNLDPSVQQVSTFSHTSTPQPNAVQSLTYNLVADTRVYSTSIQQGFLTGGSVTLSLRNNYLNENSPTNILDPSNAANLSLSFQHSLLRGFGIAVNSRTITVSKMNLNTTDLNFRTRVIGVVNQVLNSYFGLAAAHEDVKAKMLAAEVAQTLCDNTKKQVEYGAMAPTEIIRAETLVASSRLALVNAQTSLEQQELRLKSILSRTGTSDPLLASARILPLDRITMPEKDDLPPVEQLVQQALANRSDLAAAKAGLEASRVSALGTKNGVLPNLVVFGAESHAGLAGTPRAVGGPDPYFIGGVGTAMAQAMRRNFPTDRIGAYFQAPLQNRQAQADHAIDQLQVRQTELSTQKSLNQVDVQIRNAIVALQQARARYDAAVKNRTLQQELLNGEQKKYTLGASTPANVIQQQRDLNTAQSAEVAALVAYSNARVGLDQALGRTLEANHVSIAEAQAGAVSRRSSLPESSPK